MVEEGLQYYQAAQFIKLSAAGTRGHTTLAVNRRSASVSVQG